MPFSSNKAVAHGAALSHIDRDNHKVATRVARVTYGLVCMLPVDENDEAHIRRKRRWKRDLDGVWCIPGSFEAKLCKVGRLL